MTANNLYMDFRGTKSFKEVEALINNLPQRIQNADITLFNKLTKSQKSILGDVYWRKINRTGIYTYREKTYVRYNYERPKVKITINVKYNTSSKSLEEIDVKLQFGQPMDYTISDDLPETDSIKFTISPLQNVEHIVI